MTPQERLQAAEAAWLASDPFEIGAMAASYRLHNELERARVAVYDAGGCCGCHGVVSGECKSSAIRLRRMERLRAGGMGSRGVETLRELCEASEEWQAIEMVYRVANETGRVTVAQAAAAIERAGQ